MLEYIDIFILRTILSRIYKEQINRYIFFSNFMYKLSINLKFITHKSFIIYIYLEEFFCEQYTDLEQSITFLATQYGSIKHIFSDNLHLQLHTMVLDNSAKFALYLNEGELFEEFQYLGKIYPSAFYDLLF